MRPGKEWRSSARWLTGIVGFALMLFVAVTTFVDREDSGTVLERATLNLGLYVERVFFLAVILTAMIAVYIASRADE